MFPILCYTLFQCHASGPTTRCVCLWIGLCFFQNETNERVMEKRMFLHMAQLSYAPISLFRIGMKLCRLISPRSGCGTDNKPLSVVLVVADAASGCGKHLPLNSFLLVCGFVSHPLQSWLFCLLYYLMMFEAGLCTW